MIQRHLHPKLVQLKNGKKYDVKFIPNQRLHIIFFKEEKIINKF